MFPLLLLACTPDGVAPSDSADPEDSGGDTAGLDTGGDTAAPFEPPSWCPAAEAGRQEVTTTDAAPYFIRHPDEVDAPIVLFLPGGPGDRGSASAGWAAFFGEEATTRGYRIVMPYVTAPGYPTEAVPPVEAVLDEVFTCFGGDPAHVHLVGHSNGGYLAYNVVGPDLGDRWTTITGAPAYFRTIQKKQLEGVAFHHAAGEDDAEWLAAMEEAHADLQALGFESELTVWPGQGHTPGPDWDGRDGMFDFWDRH